MTSETKEKRTSLETFPRPTSNVGFPNIGDYQAWEEELEKQLLSELSPKINPAYDGWGNLETDAKVQVYLRVLGLTKEQAWDRIKKLGFDKFDRPYY